MILHLHRYSYSPSETEGKLYLGDRASLSTIELPWLGNRKGVSCVPDGEYRLDPFTRPSGEEAYILSNPDLRVWRFEYEIPQGIEGRSLILIHAANLASELRGCIAPGMGRGILRSRSTGLLSRGVVESRKAMAELRSVLGKETHTLIITPLLGASL